MKQCVIIYNPMSGKKTFKSQLNSVTKTLESKGFTWNIKETAYPRHATELVKEACFDKVDMLLISGGDGTMNEVIEGLIESTHQPVIAYIPSGTACDLGKTLGLSKNVKKTLSIIEKNDVVSMDLAKSSHGYFAYVTALGNYVDISYATDSRLKKFFGYGAYLLMGIKQFFTVPMIKLKLVLDEDKVIEGYFSLVMVVNSKRVASFNIINTPTLDDGYLDIVLYRYIPLFNNVLYFLGFLFNPRWLPGVKKLKVKRVRIDTDHHKKWNIDGEATNSGNQLIEVIPKRMNIIINKKKSGRFFKHQKEDFYV